VCCDGARDADQPGSVRGVQLALGRPEAGFVVGAVALWEARGAWEGELDEDSND
jgi:hypothetical protein